MAKKVIGSADEQNKSLASDVKVHALASALNDMKTQIVESRIQGSVRVFGCYGVGGITTDELCVKMNGNKAEVFLPENVYNSLLRKAISDEPEALAKGDLKEGMKKLLLKPDELARIEGFTNYLPIFKAISSCSISIADVTYESPKVIKEVGEVLENEHKVISEKETSGFTGRWSIREFGTEFVLGAMERYNKNKLPRATVEKTVEVRQEVKEPKETPVVSKAQTTQKEAATQQEAAKEESYTFRNMGDFDNTISTYSPVERGVMDAIGKVIERKGAITKSEFKEIFISHGMRFWANNRLGILLRNHDLIRVREELPPEETSEAKIPEAQLPAKEVFKPLASEELCNKLSTLFKGMNEKEVDAGFVTENKGWIRVFGFRARKGIVLRDEACIDIAIDINFGGGRAWIHLDKGFESKLLKTGVLPVSDEVKTEFGFRRPVREGMEGRGPKPSYVSYQDILKPEVQERLIEYPEFNNFISILQFLKSQKITSSITTLTHTDGRFIEAIKNKYLTVLRITELERGGSKPEEAVKMVCATMKSTVELQAELKEHGMREEALLLDKIMARKFHQTNFDNLVFFWSHHPPQKVEDIVVSLTGNDPNEVKKFIENAIGEKEKGIRELGEKVAKQRTVVQHAVSAGFEMAMRDDLALLVGSLKEETGYLSNLRKACEMLNRYGEFSKSYEGGRERSEQPALTPAVVVGAPQLVQVEFRSPITQNEPMHPQEIVKKSIFEIAASEGLKEDEVGQCMRKCSPAKTEKIIELCKNYEFDWKNYQSVFICSLENLESNLHMCKYNHLDPTQLGLVVDLRNDNDLFKSRLKAEMAQRGLEFREPPQQIVIKAETQTEEKVKSLGYHGLKPGRKSLTAEQIEDKRKKIKAFCEEKGIDIEHHPSLYTTSFENLKRIVEKCEEKHITFTPYHNFLPFVFETFNRDIEIIEKYNSENPEFSKFDLNECTCVLAFAPNTLSQNLKTCVENKRDPVKEGFASRLNLEPSKFIEYLHSHEPELTEEEKRKKVIEIMANHGLKEKDIADHVKARSPVTVERIIEICDRHSFDWKTHQIVFSAGPNILESNLSLCDFNNVGPAELQVTASLTYSYEFFKTHLKVVMAQRGLEFREAENQ